MTIKKKIILVIFWIIVGGCTEVPTHSNSSLESIIPKSISKSSGNNIQICVDYFSTIDSHNNSLQIIWRYTHHNWTIKNYLTLCNNGIRVGYADHNLKVKLHFLESKIKNFSHRQIFITILNNTTGYIHIGEDVYLPRFVYDGKLYSFHVIEHRLVGAILKVHARIIHSNLVEIKLTPVFSRLLPNGKDLECEKLSTTVVVPNKKSVVIGGMKDKVNSVGASLFYFKDRHLRKREVIILVTPTIF